MKFRYIGPAGSVSAFGVHFPYGEAVEVADRYAPKLAGNRFFDAAPDDTQPQPTGAGTDRASLIATAEKHSIQIDKRWSTSRIADAIIAHSNSMKGA